MEGLCANKARLALRVVRAFLDRDREGKLPPGPKKQSREQLDAVEAAYAALDAASRGDDALAAEIVALGVFEASQRRREALLARNVTVTKHWVTTE